MAESQAWWAAPRGQWKSLDQAGYVLQTGLQGSGLFSPEGLLRGYPPAHPGRPSQALPAGKNPWASFLPCFLRSSASGPGHHTCPLTTYIKGSEAKYWTDDVGQRALGRACKLQKKRVLAFPAQEEGTCSVILTKKPPEGQNRALFSPSRVRDYVVVSPHTSTHLTPPALGIFMTLLGYHAHIEKKVKLSYKHNVFFVIRLVSPTFG